MKLNIFKFCDNIPAQFPFEFVHVICLKIHLQNFWSSINLSLQAEIVFQ